jgi:hypothetical protein
MSMDLIVEPGFSRYFPEWHPWRWPDIDEDMNEFALIAEDHQGTGSGEVLPSG